MTKKTAFNPALEPIRGELPGALAEGIGRAIARHSYLEWVLGQVLYSLMEISIKQGRAVVQRPQPRQYVAAIQGLYAFHKLEVDFDFDDLCKRIAAADRAHDAVTHSVFMRDINASATRVHLVHGSWANGAETSVVSRGEWPETPVLDRDLMSRLRKDVEKAVKGAERLRDLTDDLLRKLHDARRTNPRLNRRKRDRR
jgi:hypothetical protein